MLKLDLLLYALTTCIIRYHDNTVTPEIKLCVIDSPEGARAYAETFFDKNAQEYSLHLQKMIGVIVAIDESRRPYLEYLRDLIIYFKMLRDTPREFTEKKLADHQQQFNRIFNDFQSLLGKTKSETYKAFHPVKATIELSGLKESGWKAMAQTYCRSGQHLLDEIFHAFNKKLDSGVSFEKIAVDLCKEQHMRHLQMQNEQLANKNAQLEQELSKEKSKYTCLPKAGFTTFAQNSAVIARLTKVSAIHEAIVSSSAKDEDEAESSQHPTF